MSKLTIPPLPQKPNWTAYLKELPSGSVTLDVKRLDNEWTKWVQPIIDLLRNAKVIAGSNGVWEERSGEPGDEHIGIVIGKTNIGPDSFERICKDILDMNEFTSKEYQIYERVRALVDKGVRDAKEN